MLNRKYLTQKFCPTNKVHVQAHAYNIYVLAHCDVTPFCDVHEPNIVAIKGCRTALVHSFPTLRSQREVKTTIRLIHSVDNPVNVDQIYIACGNP